MIRVRLHGLNVSQLKQSQVMRTTVWTEPGELLLAVALRFL